MIKGLNYAKIGGFTIINGSLNLLFYLFTVQGEGKDSYK